MNWLEGLAQSAVLTKAPMDFYTSEQVAERLGVCVRTALDRIYGEIKAGRLVSVVVRVNRGGRFMQVRHYGPPAKGAKFKRAKNAAAR